jgi:hypothetical protein
MTDTGTQRKYPDIRYALGRMLIHPKCPRVEVDDWQALDVSDKPMGKTVELRNPILAFPIPETVKQLQRLIGPNLPFAEAQFQDRVSGKPLNPPPSAELWPFMQRGHEDVTKQGKFSHTYPERFWPRYEAPAYGELSQREGIRFRYGDLNDVVDLLQRLPTTRQAYLPIFFPEDTGAHHKERIPCTLGYHFLIREGRLHITYLIRSCDFLRHFPDDVYMACRLGQWVRDQLPDANQGMGDLTMHIMSLHVFEADLPRMEKEFADT